MIVSVRREHHGNVSWAWWNFLVPSLCRFITEKPGLSRWEGRRGGSMSPLSVHVALWVLHCWPLKGRSLVLENALPNSSTMTACSSGVGARVRALSLGCSVPADSHGKGKSNHSSYTPSFSELMAEENPLPSQRHGKGALSSPAQMSSYGKHVWPQFCTAKMTLLMLILLIAQFPASFKDGRGWGTESDEALKIPH